VIAARLEEVRARIAAACVAAGRSPDEVQLVAVSKRHPPEKVREAYAAGHRVFAENYAQELESKAQALADLEDLRWHFVGHLQRNKAKLVVPLGAVVETVDSERLARALDQRADREERTVEVFVQVNLGGEAQKSGCAPAEAPRLIQVARDAPRLRLRGLMTVPPAGDLELARTIFGRLRTLAHAEGVRELSMGMSADLEVAVEEGATTVRVGTAIFGPRPR